MKLSLKLPLAFALALALLLSGALFGIWKLNGAVNSFERDVLHEVASNKKIATISAHFAVAIQEWKTPFCAAPIRRTRKSTGTRT